MTIDQDVLDPEREVARDVGRLLTVALYRLDDLPPGRAKTTVGIQILAARSAASVWVNQTHRMSAGFSAGWDVA